MRRKSNRSSITFIAILLILCVIIVLQARRVNNLTGRLESITVLDWVADSLRVENAFHHNIPVVLVTPEFIDNTFRHHSPFLDRNSYAELQDKFFRYGEFDLYGSGRRTGNIRRIHEGVDLYVPENTPVYPVFPLGIVTGVSDDPDHIFYTTGYRGDIKVDSVGVEYGKIVRILYPEGIESLYAHLNEVFVKPGQIVTKEMPVGLTGYTGNIRNSGKPSHLHLELRDVNGESFDPENRLHYQFASLRRFIENFVINNEISEE